MLHKSLASTLSYNTHPATASIAALSVALIVSFKFQIAMSFADSSSLSNAVPTFPFAFVSVPQTGSRWPPEVYAALRNRYWAQAQAESPHHCGSKRGRDDPTTFGEPHLQWRRVGYVLSPTFPESSLESHSTHGWCEDRKLVNGRVPECTKGLQVWHPANLLCVVDIML